MLSKNVLIFCAPRTGSTILANYIAQCLDGQVITGDYGIDVADQDKSLVVKMEDTFLIPEPIKEYFEELLKNYSNYKNIIKINK